jgi:hypothetical protein
MSFGLQSQKLPKRAKWRFFKIKSVGGQILPKIRLTGHSVVRDGMTWACENYPAVFGFGSASARLPCDNEVRQQALSARSSFPLPRAIGEG